MNYKSAPLGFLRETWEQFVRDGILIVPNALEQTQTRELANLVSSYGQEGSADSFDLMNIVEMHPAFSQLIDHKAHIGYIYDVFGESTKLLLSQFFIRPPGISQRNPWHFDGPRQVPFQVFSPGLPLRIKVGYWLTDLPDEKMGNFIFLRGSHRQPHLQQYCTHDPVPGEEVLRAAAGTMILMFEGLWHRVDENLSDKTRLNVFLEYGPAWITATDRWRSNLVWLEALTRERRLLMRDHEFPNSLIKPPAADVPLYTLREGEMDLDAENYRARVPTELRKRHTWLERNGYA